MFENRALRRIFVRKTQRVPGGLGKLQNKKIHNLHIALHQRLSGKSIERG